MNLTVARDPDLIAPLGQGVLHTDDVPHDIGRQGVYSSQCFYIVENLALAAVDDGRGVVPEMAQIDAIELSRPDSHQMGALEIVVEFVTSPFLDVVDGAGHFHASQGVRHHYPVYGLAAVLIVRVPLNKLGNTITGKVDDRSVHSCSLDRFGVVIQDGVDHRFPNIASGHVAHTRSWPWIQIILTTI